MITPMAKIYFTPRLDMNESEFEVLCTYWCAADDVISDFFSKITPHMCTAEKLTN